MEVVFRLGIFAAVVLILGGLEILAPRRKQAISRSRRWLSNFGLVLVNSAMVRLAFPASALGFAFFAEEKGWGLFHFVDLPFYLEVLISVILLDLVIYFQHVVFHRIPILWRLHKVHHADPEFDVSTAIRFHPIEILLSMGVKFVAIVALGAPGIAVLIFEILLSSVAAFNHSNLGIPLSLDKYLRWFIVTPDMHRVHHSQIVDETNSNYGFNLPWWDRLFRTYVPQPQKGHCDMDIGLSSYTDPKEIINLPGMLKMPFTKID